MKHGEARGAENADRLGGVDWSNYKALAPGHRGPQAPLRLDEGPTRWPRYSGRRV